MGGQPVRDRLGPMIQPHSPSRWESGKHSHVFHYSTGAPLLLNAFDCPLDNGWEVPSQEAARKPPLPMGGKKAAHPVGDKKVASPTHPLTQRPDVVKFVTELSIIWTLKGAP